MANLTTAIQPFLNPQQASAGLTDMAVDVTEGSARTMALAALDEARDILEALSDDPVNQGAARAMVRDMQSLYDTVMLAPRGMLPGNIVQRANGCLQDVRRAAAEAFMKTTQAHAAEKSVIAESVNEIRRAKRDVETAIESLARMPAKIIKATTGIDLESDDERERVAARRREEATKAREAKLGFVPQSIRSKVAAVFVTTEIVGKKGGTALGAGGTVLAGLATGDEDVTREGIRVTAFGIKRNLTPLIGEEAAQDVAHKARVVAETGLVVPGTVKDTMGAGFIDMVTGKGGEDEALAMGRGASRRLQAFGVDKDDAEAVGRKVKGTLMVAPVMIAKTRVVVADAGQTTKTAVTDTVHNAQEAARKADKARDDIADRAADKLATFDKFGQNIAGLRQFIQSDKGLRNIFDKDHDGIVEIHEIREVLKDKYKVKNLDGLDANNDGKYGLDDIRMITAMASPAGAKPAAGKPGPAKK